MATSLQINTGFKLAGLIHGRPVAQRDAALIYPLGYFRLEEIFTVEVVDQLLRNIGEDPSILTTSPTKGFEYFLAVEILEFLDGANLTVDGRRLDLTSSSSSDYNATFTDNGEYRRVIKRQIQSLKNQAIRLSEIPVPIVTPSGGGSGGTTFVPTQENIYPLVKRIMVEGTATTLTEDDRASTIAVNATSTGGGGGTVLAVTSDSTLTGNGTPVSPLSVAVPFSSTEKTNLLNLLSAGGGSTTTATRLDDPNQASMSMRDPDPNPVLYQIIRDQDLRADQSENKFILPRRGSTVLPIVYDNADYDHDRRGTTDPYKIFAVPVDTDTRLTFADAEWGLIIQINDEFIFRNSYQVSLTGYSDQTDLEAGFSSRGISRLIYARGFAFGVLIRNEDGMNRPLTLITTPDGTFPDNAAADGPYRLKNVWYVPNIQLIKQYLSELGISAVTPDPDPLDYDAFNTFLTTTESGQSDSNMLRVDKLKESTLDTYRIGPSRSQEAEVLKSRLEDEPYWEGINEVPDTPGTSTGIGHVLTVTGENDGDYTWRAPTGGSSTTQPTGQIVYRQIGTGLANNAVFTILDNENTLFIEMDLTGTANIATMTIRVMPDGESAAYTIEEQAQRPAGFTLARSGNNFTVSNLVQVVSIAVYSVRSSGVKGDKGDPGTTFTPSQANLYGSVKDIIVPGTNTTLTENDSANTIAVNVDIPTVTPFTPSQANLYSSVKDIFVPGTNTTLTESDDANTIAVNATASPIIFAEPRFTPDYFIKNDNIHRFILHLDPAAIGDATQARVDFGGIVKTITVSKDTTSYLFNLSTTDSANLNRAHSDGGAINIRITFVQNENVFHTILFAVTTIPATGGGLVKSRTFDFSSQNRFGRATTRRVNSVDITESFSGVLETGLDVEIGDEYLYTFSKLGNREYSGPEALIDVFYDRIDAYARHELFKPYINVAGAYQGALALAIGPTSASDKELKFQVFARGLQAAAAIQNSIFNFFRMNIYKL